jgi:KRAB domain-containing zinc finger protein
MKKVKIEPFDDDSEQIESVDCVVSNIKKEPEVEFVLILPPRQVKVEKFEEKETDEKKFQCQQCSKSFEKPKNLYQHKQTHKPKTKCQVCSKEISTQTFKAHLKKHQFMQNFNCDHCSAGFVFKGDLVQHMWKHRSSKQFKCKHCNRGFNNRQNFNAHLQSHSNNPRPFQCDLCSNNYPTKREIQNHLIAIHTDQSFSCNECDFMTKWQTHLNQHQGRVHSNAKPFECPTCKKKFKTKPEVLQHQSVHKTTNDFECKTCGKMFRSQTNMRRHKLRNHGKEFNFSI